MPRKGAATAAKPASEPEVTEQTEVAGEELPGPGTESAKPARRSRKTPEERAAQRAEAAETRGPQEDHGEPAEGFQDWSRPDYADDPGEFEFGALDDGDEYLSILWWGKEGTGKTTDLARVAATKLAPKVKGRILIINAEGGAKATPLRKQGIDTSRIDVFPTAGKSVTFEGLERLYYRLADDLDKDPDSWAAVGWDSITAIFQKLLDDVVEADMRKQAEILQRAKKGREGRSGNITLRDRFEVDGDDYIKESNQLRLLLRKYRTLPCHFLVTALERRDEDRKRKGAKAHYGPAVNPAVATDLLGYMDIVIRTHVLDEAVYYGRTTPTDDARGKDRMFALPVELVDPTFDRIYAYVHGELDPDTDRTQKRMPSGAEGVPIRRSLADEDKDIPEPPKAVRRSAASSGRTSARAKPSATETAASSEPDSAAPESESAAEEPPKAGERRSRTQSKPSSEPSEEKTAGTEEPPKPPARRSGRKTSADREAAAARERVKAETEGTKSPGPATRAARARADQTRQAAAAGSSGGFSGEPPF